MGSEGPVPLYGEGTKWEVRGKYSGRGVICLHWDTELPLSYYITITSLLHHSNECISPLSEDPFVP